MAFLTAIPNGANLLQKPAIPKRFGIFVDNEFRSRDIPFLAKVIMRNDLEFDGPNPCAGDRNRFSKTAMKPSRHS